MAPLDVDTLRGRIDRGEIDTVVVAFPDLQGRLMGKRVTGHYFLDHVLAPGAGGRPTGIERATTCSRSTST